MIRSRVVLGAMSVLVAAGAQAQTINPGSGTVVKPRVFVVFDTSTSMREVPDYLTSFVDVNSTGNEDTSDDPDAVVVPAANCRSKFCIAKKTVYETLKPYIQNNSIRLGVASYYQYLVKYEPYDGRISKCWYDAMFKPGQRLWYPNNGSYMLDAFRLPGLTAQNLSGPASGVSNHQYCKPASATYNMATIEEMAAGTASCTLHDRLVAPAANVTIAASPPTGTACTAGRSYSPSTYDGADTNSGAFFRYRIPAASSCPAAVPMTGDYTAAPGASTFVLNGSVASQWDQCAADPFRVNCWESGAVPYPGAGTPAATAQANMRTKCNAGHPCRMYSASSGAEVNINRPYYWPTGFGGSCNTGSQPTAGNTGDNRVTAGVCDTPVWSSATVGGFYNAARTETAVSTLTSDFDEGVGGTCNGLTVSPSAVRRTDGNLSNFVSPGGYANWSARIAGVTGATGTLDPSFTGACLNTACDVRLVSRTFRTNDSVITTNNTCTPAAGPPAVSCNDGAAPDTLRRVVKSGSCPAVAGPYASGAAVIALGTWQDDPNGYGCTAGDPCSFTPNATPEFVSTITGCNATASTWNGMAPANCTGNGQNRAYVAGSTTTSYVYIDKTAGAACSDTSANISFTGTTAPAGMQLSTCLGTGACSVYAGVASDSPTTESSTTVLGAAYGLNNAGPPVSTPPWADETETPLGTFFDAPPSYCDSGFTDGNFYNLDTGGSVFRNLRFRRGGVDGAPNGATRTGGTLETPTFNCRFEHVRRTWTRPMRRCTYEIRRRDYTVDNSLTWCNFDQKRIQRTTLTPLYTCRYEVPVRSFNFTPPNHKVCNYFRTSTVMTRPTPQVRYSYFTLGGEILGSYFREFPAVNALTDAYGTFQTQCPVQVDECWGPGTTCYLRNTNVLEAARFDQPSITTGTNTGGTRHSNHAGVGYTPRYLLPVGSMGVPGTLVQPNPLSETNGHSGVRTSYGGSYLGGFLCRAADYLPAPVTPPATRNAFAAYNGAIISQMQYKLVSNYYHPGDPNDIASLNTDPRTNPATTLNPTTLGAYATLTDAHWTNAPTKEYGASTTGPTFSTPNLQMMRFPADNDPDGDIDQFKKLMSKCYRPVVSDGGVGGVVWPAPAMSPSPLVDRAGNKVEWDHLGLCMPNTGTRNPTTSVDGGITDFTPLYGSLENARQYISNELATDPNHQCRRYYVVLATDGAENTPRNGDYRNTTALTNVVAALRSTTGGGRTTDVNTFVLGFGDATANPTEAYNLNQMAISGNTTSAYFATNSADLQTRLAQIFNTITQGTYSRSRPVLTSDGQGLYAGFYVVNSDSAEWQGFFAAIGFNGGTQVTRWEFNRKINEAMNDGDRNVYTVTGADCADTDYEGVCRNGTRRAWTVANQAQITPLLNTDTDYFGGAGYNGPTTGTQLNPLRVLQFVRNIAKVTGPAYGPLANGTGEDFFQTAPADKRQSRYGATVKSIPAVVSRSFNGPEWGGPTGSPSRSSYATYQASVLNREQRVVFGSADGLIRGVRDRVSGDTNCQSSVADGGTDDNANNCSNGKEAWGFVPEMLQPMLYRNMTGYNYGVDGETWLEDICTDSNAANCSAAEWKTVAFMGMRGGARGVQALDVTNPNDPQSLWAFRRNRYEDQLGYPVTAAVGRVEVSGGDKFIAVIPGGTRENGIFGDLSQNNADEVYVLNAATGRHIEFFNSNGTSNCASNDWDDVIGCKDLSGQDNQFIAKPSYFRRLGSPYMDNMALSGTSGLVYLMRFRKTVKVQGNGTIRVDPHDDSDDWKPHRFFDPTNVNTSRDPLGDQVRVRRVVSTTTADGGTTYDLQDCAALADGSGPGGTCGALPLPAARRLPLHNRPRAAAIYDSSGLTADYFFGTGDTLDPVNPSPEFVRNYFYAVHDRNDRDNGRDDGRPLWVNQFLNRREQVVGDAVLVNGNVLVTTYLPPPTTASDCLEPGSAFMYCFNPKNGNLVQCLTEGGVPTSVRPLGDIGIPTPPQCIGNDCYVLGSNSPPGPDGVPRLQRTTISPATPSGDTRSFRRVR